MRFKHAIITALWLITFLPSVAVGHDGRWGDRAHLGLEVTGDASISGDLTVTGTTELQGHTTLLDDIDLIWGTNSDIRARYDEAGDDRLEFTDGTNLLLYLEDAGTDGILGIVGKAYVGDGTYPTWDAVTLLGVETAMEVTGTIIMSRDDAAITADEVLGNISMEGNDSDAPNGRGALILAKSDGAWTGSADTPARFEFHTTPDGSGSPVLAATIESNGTLTVDSGTLAVAGASSSLAFTVASPDVTFTGTLDMGGDVNQDGAVSYISSTLADGDATPDISAGNKYFTSQENTGGTEITDFDNPIVGQEVCIIVGHAGNAPTITDGGSFAMNGGWAPDSIDDNICFYVQADNDYIEISRVDN